jgi:hypothetical protein
MRMTCAGERMDQLGSFWWVVPLGGFFGGIGIAVYGYLKKRLEATSPTWHIRGAAIADSSIGQALVNGLERIAAALEAAVDVERERDKVDSELRREAEMEGLKREIELLKRGNAP